MKLLLLLLFVQLDHKIIAAADVIYLILFFDVQSEKRYFVFAITVNACNNYKSNKFRKIRAKAVWKGQKNKDNALVDWLLISDDFFTFIET